MRGTPFSRADGRRIVHARPTRVQLLRARKNPTMISTAASTQVIGLDASNGMPNALVFRIVTRVDGVMDDRLDCQHKARNHRQRRNKRDQIGRQNPAERSRLQKRSMHHQKAVIPPGAKHHDRDEEYSEIELPH